MFKRVLLLLLLLALALLTPPAVAFRDDFDGTSLETSVWDVRKDGKLSYSVNNGVLRIDCGSALQKSYLWIYTKETYSTPVVIETRFRAKDGSSSTKSIRLHQGLLASSSPAYSLSSHSGIFQRLDYYDNLVTVRYASGSEDQIINLGKYYPPGWITHRIVINATDIKVYDAGGALLGSAIHSYSSGKVAIGWTDYSNRLGWAEIDYIEINSPSSVTEGEPCTINVYDADSRLPLSGVWGYYVVIEGADAVSGSASGASKTIHLPATSILQPHLLRVTKDGYVQVPETLAFNVPAGGREIPVYLRSTTAPPEEGNVWLGFVCTDADTGSPVSSALVNVDGSAQYTGASGYVRFQVPMNSTHKWVASSSSHWPMGGNVTVETADLNVSVELVGKTSDLPRPPLPDLPNFPVIHPVLDPSVFRAQILSVPILGGLASPILDTMDAIAVGLDDIVHPILDFVTAPADSVLQALEGVGDQLTVSVTTYTNIAGVVLGSVGKLLAVFPDLVVGLVTYNLVLDLVYLLLRGGL